MQKSRRKSIKAEETQVFTRTPTLKELKAKEAQKSADKSRNDLKRAKKNQSELNLNKTQNIDIRQMVMMICCKTFNK